MGRRRWIEGRSLAGHQAATILLMRNHTLRDKPLDPKYFAM
jgi:hypothetical protein